VPETTRSAPPAAAPPYPPAQRGHPCGREHEEAIRSLVDLIPDGVVVHQNGWVVYANAAMRSLVRWSDEETLDQDVFDFIHPDQHPMLAERFSKIKEVGVPQEPVELTVCRADGSVVRVESVSILILWEGAQAILGILHDLTHETARRNAEQRFAAVVSALEEGVVVVDTTGLVESVNAAAERVFGHSAEHLIGTAARDLPLLSHDGTPLGDLSPIVVAHQTGVPQPDRGVVVDRPDGSRVWLTAHSRPLMSSGPPCPAVLSFTDVSDRRAAAMELRHAATHDSLTGLPNRALLIEAIEDARDAMLPTDMLALLYVDIDDLKALNDSGGHALGDEALRTVSKRLIAQVRDIDIVARIGGDEFVVLAAVSDTDDADALATRLLSGLTRPTTGMLRGHPIQACVGIVTATGDDPRTATDLLRDADAAVYQAKSYGRNRTAIFDAEIRAAVLRRLQLEGDLRAALTGSGLWVAYQAQVDLATGMWVGAEALSRWNHPVQGLVNPLEFIGIAEQSDLIHSLGQRTLATACRDAITLRSASSSDLTMSVNVSVRQLDDTDFVGHVEEVLSVSGLPAPALCLEVTESSLALDEIHAGRSLHPLRDLGIRIAIDDFGTGYSSLARLRTLPVDELKIDRSFVTPLTNDRRSRDVVAGIITLAHALDMRVVAEGVETSGHVNTLAELGCDVAQGYHFGRPVRVADFAIPSGPDPSWQLDPRPRS
jgi:diguanylate cyclase (GGDEF)-like protein/PAS domain S-box-containing protein